MCYKRTSQVICSLVRCKAKTHRAVETSENIRHTALGTGCCLTVTHSQRNMCAAVLRPCVLECDCVRFHMLMHSLNCQFYSLLCVRLPCTLSLLVALSLPLSLSLVRSMSVCQRNVCNTIQSALRLCCLYGVLDVGENKRQPKLLKLSRSIYLWLCVECARTITT